MRGLYVIADLARLDASGVSLIEFARAVLEARPAALQLRAKHASAARTLELLRELRALTAHSETLLFNNDRPDLAVLAGCDGVHVGQSDLSVADVRRFAPQLRVGVSTHSERQLHDALAARPDYAAFGPVFSTGSKVQPEPTVGVGALIRAYPLASSAGIPLVAIGGLTNARASEVSSHCDAIAVIGALAQVSIEQTATAARALRAAFDA